MQINNLCITRDTCSYIFYIDLNLFHTLFHSVQLLRIVFYHYYSLFQFNKLHFFRRRLFDIYCKRRIFPNFVLSRKSEQVLFRIARQKQGFWGHKQGFPNIPNIRNIWNTFFSVYTEYIASKSNLYFREKLVRTQILIENLIMSLVVRALF